jgi:hypothetical protein
MMSCTKFLQLKSRSSQYFKRSLHYQTLNLDNNGNVVYGLRKNIIRQQGTAEYANESWQTLTSNILKSNTFYISRQSYS